MNRNLLEDKIKNVLILNRIPNTPANIINACFETIYTLSEQKQTDEIISNILSLSELIQRMKVFKLTPISIKSIEVILKIKPSLGCSILKNYFKDVKQSILTSSDGSLDSHLFRILIKNSNSISVANLISKYYDMATFFNTCDIDQKINLLMTSMHACASYCDVIKFIKSCEKPLNNVILSYLQFRLDSPLTFDEIREIISLISSESSLNFQIISHILQLYRTITLKSKTENLYSEKQKNSNIFTPYLIELIKREVLEGEHDEQCLIDMFSSISDNLLPHFIGIIKEVNEKFLSEGKFQKLLKILVSYIKIEDFAEIIGELDISKHFTILKGLSNVDLGVFIEIYKIARKGTDFESLSLDTSKSAGFTCIASEPGYRALDCALSILPNFAYYCTDSNRNIDNIILILRSHFHTHRNIVCNAIEKLIQSHRSNISEILTMNNPIPKQNSTAILETLKNSGLVYDLLNSYTQFNDDNAATALKFMIDLTNIDFSSQLISAITENSHEIPLCSALRLMTFFVRNTNFDFDLINRILELAAGSRIDIQKKAYDLLSSIYSYSATDVCICDVLYSTLQKSVQQPSLKSRFNLQFTILKHGCKGCRVNDRNEFFVKFINELIKNLKSSNSKCKKFINEIIMKLTDDEFFINYIFSQMTRKNPDCSMVCGAVECALIVLEYVINNQQYIESHGSDNSILFDRMFEGIQEISLYTHEVVKPIIKILHFFLNKKFYIQISGIIDSYIHQFSKKYNRELKDLCIKAQKNGFSLTKTMKTLLKFKNKGGQSNEIKVLEKPDFERLI